MEKLIYKNAQKEVRVSRKVLVKHAETATVYMTFFAIMISMVITVPYVNRLAFIVTSFVLLSVVSSSKHATMRSEYYFLLNCANIFALILVIIAMVF